MILYRAVYSPFSTSHLHAFLIKFNTLASGKILLWFGEEVVVNNSTIISEKFAVSVIFDCCAIEPILIYLSAILSYPFHLKSKVIALAAGIPILIAVNIIRIVSLYYFGAYYGKLVMERMHLDVWQVLIIILSLTLFLFWIYFFGLRTKNPLPGNE